MENLENGAFPRIIGAIDGTHIRIRAPTKDRVAYINRKKFHSLNTQVGKRTHTLFYLSVD